MCGTDPWSMAEEFAVKEDMDSSCTCLHGYLDNFYAEPNIHKKTSVMVLMAVSLVCESLAIYFITNFEGLNQHPMKLSMWLSVANFSFLWSSLFGGYICEWGLPLILDLTTFNAFIDWFVLEKLVVAAMFQTTFAYTAAIVINICLCHDLIYCLRDPMRSPEGRYPVYGALIFSLAFITGAVRVGSENLHMFGYIIQGIFCIYLSFAVASIIFAFRFVRKPGISQEARQEIVRVHITYIVVNVVCQMYNIISRAIMPVHMGHQDHINFGTWYWIILEALFFGQGLWLALVRFSETLFAQTVWYNLKKKFSKSRAEEKYLINKSDRDDQWTVIE